MKNKINSVFANTIDCLLWYIIWGAMIYFCVVAGAFIVSASDTTIAQPIETVKNTVAHNATVKPQARGRLHPPRGNGFVLKPNPTKKSADTHTPDFLVLVYTILGEARGEGKKGMYAVACVIQQRAENRKITPAQVCKQKKQFSIWNNVKNDRELRFLLKSPSAEYAKDLAIDIEIGKKLYQGVTKHADHYHTLKVKPYWANNKKKTVKIGNHIFYKLRK